jgi:hypothetical protein
VILCLEGVKMATECLRAQHLVVVEWAFSGLYCFTVASI